MRDVVEDVIEQEIKILIAMALAAGMILKQLLDAIKDNDANSYYAYDFMGRMASASDGSTTANYIYNPVIILISRLSQSSIYSGLTKDENR